MLEHLLGHQAHKAGYDLRDFASFHSYFSKAAKKTNSKVLDEIVEKLEEHMKDHVLGLMKPRVPLPEVDEVVAKYRQLHNEPAFSDELLNKIVTEVLQCIEALRD